MPVVDISLFCWSRIRTMVFVYTPKRNVTFVNFLIIGRLDKVDCFYFVKADDILSHGLVSHSSNAHRERHGESKKDIGTYQCWKISVFWS